MRYSAAIEWIGEDSAIVRLYSDESPDPIWSCDVKKTGEIANISRVLPCQPMDSYRTIIRALRDDGMCDILYENRGLIHA